MPQLVTPSGHRAHHLGRWAPLAQLAALGCALGELASAPLATAAEPEVTAQVIGGTPLTRLRWPGMVALVNTAESENNLAQFCAGTLVGPRTVLTAAHCVNGQAPAKVAVLVGTHDLSTGGRRIASASFTLHPDFNATTLDSDVAVIQLAQAVTDIQPVKFIDSLKKETTHAPAGSSVLVAGWGLTERGWTDQAVQARLKVVDHASCASFYAAKDAPLTDNMLCANWPKHGHAICGGDSGGPLWALDANGRFKLQVGVVSWTDDRCANPGSPDGFARLATLGAWVRQQIQR